MRFPGFVGGTYQMRSITTDCQRCVNMYADLDEMGTAKEGEVGALVGTPGISVLVSLPTQPTRGIWIGSNNNRVFVVSGNTLYELINISGTWSYATLGILNTSLGNVGMSDNGIQLCVVDGKYGYSYNFTEMNLLSFYIFFVPATTSASIGATYSNNANTFTVQSGILPLYNFTTSTASAKTGAVYTDPNTGDKFTALSGVSLGTSFIFSGNNLPTLNYSFSTTSANVTAGAVYSDPNNNLFKIQTTIIGQTIVSAYGVAAPVSGATTLTLISGTGDPVIAITSSTPLGNTFALTSGSGDSILTVASFTKGSQIIMSSNGAPTNGATLLTLASGTGDSTIAADGSIPTTSIPWTPNTAYQFNQIIIPTAGGFQYVAIVAGTSGATEPIFPTTIYSTVTDGTVTWRRTSSFQQINDPGFLGSNIVCYQDGYFIFAKPGTNQVYSSNFSALTFNALNFLSLGGSPDPVLNIVSLYRNLYIFTTKTCEIYYDAGISPGFPFARINGAYMQQGMIAQFSLAQSANAIFWLGQDNSGQGIVYTTSQYQPQRISTFAIEESFLEYSTISDAVAYTYQEGGHQFYVLNFPTAQATWVYDISTGLWHERAYNNDGVQQMQRGIFHGFTNGIHIVCDWENGNVYQMGLNIMTDNGAWIIRKRVAPHLAKDILRVFYTSFQIDIQQGQGLDGIQQGTNPQVMLRFSDDGGRSWSNIKSASFGKIGATKTRAIFRRLGQARDRVFEITISDPVFVALVGAELYLDLGAS